MRKTLMAVLLALLVCLTSAAALAVDAADLPVMDYEGFYAYITSKGIAVPTNYDEALAMVKQVLPEGEGEIAIVVDDLTITYYMTASDGWVAVYIARDDRLQQGTSEVLEFTSFPENAYRWVEYWFNDHRVAYQLAMGPELALSWVDNTAVGPGESVFYAQYYPYPSWLLSANETQVDAATGLPVPVLDYEGYYAYITYKGVAVPTNYDEALAMVKQVMPEGEETIEVVVDDLTITYNLTASDGWVGVYIACDNCFKDGATEILSFTSYPGNAYRWVGYDLNDHRVSFQLAMGPERALSWVDNTAVGPDEAEFYAQYYPYPSWLK